MYRGGSTGGPLEELAVASAAPQPSTVESFCEESIGAAAIVH
jgi:hypothetical protein